GRDGTPAPTYRGVAAAALFDGAPGLGGSGAGGRAAQPVRMAHGAGSESGRSPDRGPQYHCVLRDFLCIQCPGPVSLRLAAGTVQQHVCSLRQWPADSAANGDHLLAAHADVVWHGSFRAGELADDSARHLWPVYHWGIRKMAAPQLWQTPTGSRLIKRVKQDF